MMPLITLIRLSALLLALSRTRQLTLTVTPILTLNPNLSPFLNTNCTIRKFATVNKRTANGVKSNRNYVRNFIRFQRKRTPIAGR